jgi:hypothetical protein
VSLWYTCNETTQFDNPKFIKKTQNLLPLSNGQFTCSEPYSGKETLFKHLAQTMLYSLTFSFDAKAAL